MEIYSKQSSSETKSTAARGRSSMRNQVERAAFTPNGFMWNRFGFSPYRVCFVDVLNARNKFY